MTCSLCELESRVVPCCPVGAPALLDPPPDGPLPVYLDLPPGDTVGANRIATEVASLLDPLDRIAVTLTPPDDFPGDYLTVVFGPLAGWNVGEPNGVALTDLRFPTANRAQPRAVYVSPTGGFGLPRTADELAVTAAHELLHAFGNPGHSDNPLSLDFGGGTTEVSRGFPPGLVGPSRWVIDAFLGGLPV